MCIEFIVFCLIYEYLYLRFWSVLVQWLLLPRNKSIAVKNIGSGRSGGGCGGRSSSRTSINSSRIIRRSSICSNISSSRRDITLLAALSDYLILVNESCDNFQV
jgi:hypothetical protein